VPENQVGGTVPSIGTFLLPPGHVQIDYSTGPCPPPDSVTPPTPRQVISPFDF
jgi:hypothetical protein